MTQDIVQRVRVVPEGGAQTVAELNRVRTSLVDVESAAKSANSTGSSFLAGARSAAGAAGGILSVAGGGQATSAVSSVLALTQAFGPFGVAVGAGTLLVKGITDAQDKAAESARSYISALQGSAGQTTDQLLQQVTAEQARIEALKESRTTLEDFQARITSLNTNYEEGFVSADGYRTILTNINSELYDFTGGAIGLKDGIGDSVSAAGDFNAVLADNRTALDAAGGKIAFYNTQLNSSATAAANAAAAEELRNKQQLADAENALRFEQMTAEQRQARIAQNEAEIANIREYVESHELAADVVQQLSDKQTDLYVETSQLRDITSSYADQLKAESDAKKAATDAYDNYMDVLDAESDARTKLGEINADIAEIETERAANAAKVLRDSEDKRSEILSEAAENQQEIAEDSARELEKIQRDFNKSNKTAIGERDAYGALQAKEAAKERLDDQRVADQKELEAAEKSDRKALAALEKAKNQQLMSIAEAAFKETNIKLAEAQRQSFLVASAQAAQSSLVASGMNQIVNVTATGMNQAVAYFTEGINRISSIAGGVQGFGTSQFSTAPPLTGSVYEAQMRNIAQQELNRTLTAATRGGRTFVP